MSFPDFSLLFPVVIAIPGFHYKIVLREGWNTCSKDVILN